MSRTGYRYFSSMPRTVSGAKDVERERRTALGGEFAASCHRLLGKSYFQKCASYRGRRHRCGRHVLSSGQRYQTSCSVCTQSRRAERFRGTRIYHGVFSLPRSSTSLKVRWQPGPARRVGLGLAIACYVLCLFSPCCPESHQDRMPRRIPIHRFHLIIIKVSTELNIDAAGTICTRFHGSRIYPFHMDFPTEVASHSGFVHLVTLGNLDTNNS